MVKLKTLIQGQISQTRLEIIMEILLKICSELHEGKYNDIEGAPFKISKFTAT